MFSLTLKGKGGGQIINYRTSTVRMSFTLVPYVLGRALCFPFGLPFAHLPLHKLVSICFFMS